ncbi:hypothetical protein [Azonexus sp.]|jgi:hypothetical protein|nr:hypothetical protein [Azonexus sp.]
MSALTEWFEDTIAYLMDEFGMSEEEASERADEIYFDSDSDDQE